MPSDDLAGAVLDALPTRVALVGPDRTVLRVNEAWRRTATGTGGGDPFWAPPGGRWPPPSTAGNDTGGWRRLVDAAEGMIGGRRDKADLEVARAAGTDRRWLHVRMRRIDGTGVVVAVDDVTAQRRREDDLRHRATHDLATGLPNRALLSGRLGKALSRPAGGGADANLNAAAVIFLDLDSFRRVNSSYGHATGDAVLAAAGRRMARALRPDDLLARWGGDEFVVLATAISSADAMQLAEDLTRAFTEPLEVGDRRVRMSVSVGLALSGPAGQDSPPRPEALVDQAGDALLRSRRRPGPRRRR